MKISRNTSKVSQELQEDILKIPPIEDGNTLEQNQGIIYTSEVVNDIFWSTNNSYESTVKNTPTYIYSTQRMAPTVQRNQRPTKTD